MKNLKKALLENIITLKPAEINHCPLETEIIYLDRDEKDNNKWMEIINEAFKSAKKFEIHCWNDEDEFIDIALNYGELKEDDWQHGKIIRGDVTEKFIDMIMNIPKPEDVQLYNKMTPFFNIFLDDHFQSCHYGTEIFIKESL